jgi:hypothetical protein
MRLLPVLLFLPLFAFQAHAQPAPTAQPAPAAQPVPAAQPASTAATAAPVTTTQAPTVTKPHRMSWQQRFAEANATHDGHLTLQQAEAGYRTIARHFREIDADKKGYLTVEDIDNWHKLQRAMRHSHQGQSLRPRPALQQGMIQPHQISTSTTATVAPMTPPESAASGGPTGAQR